VGNIETFKQFTKSVTGTQEAFKAADINSNTLANRLDELKNKFVTLITTNQNAGWSLNALKTLVIGLTNNLGTLLNIAIPVGGIFLIWKGYIWGAQIATVALNAATIAYNTLIGISTALTGGSVIAMGASTTATTAYTAVTWLATAATTALNFVMAIGVGKLLLIGTAIVAGIALIKNIVGHIDGWGKLFDNTMGFMKNSFMSLFYYPLKVQFLGIKMHFMTMVEAIVLAWNWGMNKVGLMSDKQYQKEKDNIKSLQDARLQNIKTTVDEWKGSAGQAMSSGNDALRNSLKWKTNDEMDAANASNVVTTSNSYSEQKNVVEVHVKAAAGTNASIGNNSGNVPVVTSTSKY
jgi:hypothetical protein